MILLHASLFREKKGGPLPEEGGEAKPGSTSVLPYLLGNRNPIKSIIRGYKFSCRVNTIQSIRQSTAIYNAKATEKKLS